MQIREERSYLEMNEDHLKNLGRIALNYENYLFSTKNRYECFKNKRFVILLVQGAALHYIDKKNGIKDFDVLILYCKNYTEIDEKGNMIFIPYRNLVSKDCEMPEFGRNPDKTKSFINRKLDLMMREIWLEYQNDDDLIGSLQDYFKSKRSKSIKEWNKKASVGIWPSEILGKEIFYNKKSELT